MQRLYRFSTLKLKVPTRQRTWGLYRRCLNILMKPSAHWWCLRSQLIYIFFFFMIDCEGENRKKKGLGVGGINRCELDRESKWMPESRECRIQTYGNRWQAMQKSKIVFIFLWFCSGNIRCKWNPYYRMDGRGNKDKHSLKFALPGATFCENEYCRLLHLFVFSTFIYWELATTEEQTPNSHLSNAEKVWKKAIIVYTWPTLPKPHEEQTKEKKKNPPLTHTRDIAPI